jgi:hypothetical protein
MAEHDPRDDAQSPDLFTGWLQTPAQLGAPGRVARGSRNVHDGITWRATGTARCRFDATRGGPRGLAPLWQVAALDAGGDQAEARPPWLGSHAGDVFRYWRADGTAAQRRGAIGIRHDATKA